MQQKHVITLPKGKKFCLAGEIPDLIAGAWVGGDREGNFQQIVSLAKKLRNVSRSQEQFAVEEVLEHQKLMERGAKLEAMAVMPFWVPDAPREPPGDPLTEEECEALTDIWAGAGLAPLRMPIQESDFADYRKAFSANADKFEWDLVSILDPTFAAKRIKVEWEHLDLLRTAIEQGELEQLDPESGKPVRHYLNEGMVRIEALKKYLDRYGISVQEERATAEAAKIGSGAKPPRILQREQEQAILDWLADHDYDPMELPRYVPGKEWIPALIRKDLLKSELFRGGSNPENIFEKAWGRLRRRKEIAEK